MRKTNISYEFEVGTGILLDSAFGFGDCSQLTLKECLLNDIGNDPEYFIEALEDTFNIPSYDDEENYDSITRKEWEDILDVENTGEKLTDYAENEDNSSIELKISIELDIDKFEEICNKHNIEISVDKEL